LSGVVGTEKHAELIENEEAVDLASPSTASILDLVLTPKESWSSTPAYTPLQPFFPDHSNLILDEPDFTTTNLSPLDASITEGRLPANKCKEITGNQHQNLRLPLDTTVRPNEVLHPGGSDFDDLGSDIIIPFGVAWSHIY
jgi:hypothetical protein